MRINPKLKQGFRRFRHQKRAFYSLIGLLIVFLCTLPAELLCNSRPILFHKSGRWYFPVLFDYSEKELGGQRHVNADYRSPAFWRRIGCDPVTAGLDVLEKAESETGASADNESAEDILDMFDSPESDPGPASTPAPATPKAEQKEDLAECWALWPPVRYDYAYIETDTRVGRSALVAPWPHRVPGTEKVIPSGWLDGHYLGTDNRGRDILARLVYGLRVSLIFGLLLAVSSTIVGAALGAVQGFFAGWIDLLGQRLTEIWGSLPRLYLLMILSSLLARNIIVLFVILNLTSWMGMAAYMRAEFLKGRNLDYVRAARALGVRNSGIMFRHILPNSMTPIITFFPFAVTGGILALVSLDFLNLGVPSPFPSIGELLRQGQANLHATWIIIPAFIVLSGTITMLTFIGDGLRNAFDPRKAAG